MCEGCSLGPPVVPRRQRLVFQVIFNILVALRNRIDFVSDPYPATIFQSSGSGSDPKFVEQILKFPKKNFSYFIV